MKRHKTPVQPGKGIFLPHLNHNDALFLCRKPEPRKDNRQLYRSSNQANPRGYAPKQKQVAGRADSDWTNAWENQSGFRAISQSVGLLEVKRSQLVEKQTAGDVSGKREAFQPRLNQWIIVEKSSWLKTLALVLHYIICWTLTFRTYEG